MTPPTQGEHAQTALAHELFAAAQLAPGEGIEDAVSRIAAALTAAPAQPAAPQGVAYAELPEPDATTVGLGAVWNRHSMRDFADRTHALRASHGQAPAGAVLYPGCSHWGMRDTPATAQAAPAGDEQKALAALRYYKTECSGAEPSISVFHRMVDEALGAAPTAGAVAGPDYDIDAVALARYKVVSSHDSMFHRFAVVAGDGKQQLYLGRETECQNMARKFAGAFLDGAFHQSQIAAASTPAAQAAESVLKDAARPDIDAAFEAVRRGLCKIPRYSFALDSRGNVRRCEDKSGNWIEFDAAHALFDPVAVDAARKQGAKHD